MLNKLRVIIYAIYKTIQLGIIAPFVSYERLDRESEKLDVLIDMTFKK
jgi:hypothetical protein